MKAIRMRCRIWPLSRLTARFLADFAGRSGIKTRGSSTGGQGKPSYALEVWDENNRDRDVSILGLPADSDWVLYAPFTFDRALINNAFVYDLSNRIGRYAVRTRFVEMYVNEWTRSYGPEGRRAVQMLLDRGVAERRQPLRLRRVAGPDPDVCGLTRGSQADSMDREASVSPQARA